MLKTNENYDYEVDVHAGMHSFAGNLHISPEEITITIRGEESSGRAFELDAWTISELYCYTHQDSFLLKNLKLKEGYGKSLAKNLSYFESIYHAAEIYHYPCAHSLSDNSETQRLNIYSSSIQKWVGRTGLQNEIIDHYQKGEIGEQPPGFNVEFASIAKPESAIFVYYNIKHGFSLADFRVGMTFEPVIGYEFANPVRLKKISPHIQQIITLFNFLSGEDILIDSIAFNGVFVSVSRLGSCHNPNLSKERWVAGTRPLLALNDYPTKSEPSENTTSWELIFKKYFSLTSKERSYFEKHQKYRRLGSAEERFLGLFRLLESLTHKKANFLDEEKLKRLAKKAKPFLIRYFEDRQGVTSFIQGLKRLNNSKYNTEKCIVDFFHRIPEVLRSQLTYEPSDINFICKLRNDIVHANEYSIPASEIYKIANFIDFLLTIALAEKIGVPIEDAEQYMMRHYAYFSLKNKSALK